MRAREAMAHVGKGEQGEMRPLTRFGHLNRAMRRVAADRLAYRLIGFLEERLSPTSDYRARRFERERRGVADEAEHQQVPIVTLRQLLLLPPGVRRDRIPRVVDRHELRDDASCEDLAASNQGRRKSLQPE